MEKLKITRILLTVFFVLVVVALNGKVVTPSVKFMNCEWGLSPEEATAVLKGEMPDIDIKENINLKYEDKAIGMREFISYDFSFVGNKWRLKLIFLDDKLSYVVLTSTGKTPNRLKVSKELRAEFGEYETVLDAWEEWNAIDESHLIVIETKAPRKAVIIAYQCQGYMEEIKKRKKEKLSR